MTVLEPAVRAFLERAAGPHPFELPPTEGRRALERLRTDRSGRAPVETEEATVPGGPLGPIPVRIARPRGAPAPPPAVVYLHGAGWALGSAASGGRLVADLLAGSGAALVLPRCRLAPEARYPVAIEECYAVAGWVAERGGEFGLDGSRLAIAGDSVGAGLAAVVALLAKERGGPPIRHQLLLYPATDAGLDTASHREFASGHWLRREAMRRFWDRYADAGERAEITASPLRASLDQLAGLPPALVITAEADILRDEGEAYATRLLEARVEVAAVRYRGTIHDFATLDALAETHAARAAVAQACSALRGALGGPSSRCRTGAVA